MVALQYPRIIDTIENDEEYDQVIEQIYELQISPDFDLRNKTDQERLFHLLEICRLYELLHSRPPMFDLEVTEQESSESEEEENES